MALKWVGILISLSMIKVAQAEEPLRIAVASNFGNTADKIGRLFQIESNQSVEVIKASTGQLFAQIVQGAPFDLFIASDNVRPKLLEDKGLVQKGSRFTLARGSLVLWSRNKLSVEEFEGRLRTGGSVVAIANPKTAPYGSAAKEFLKSYRGKEYSFKKATASNVSQAMQFVVTGNADFGIVAKSLALQAKSTGYMVSLPDGDKFELPQDVVVLKSSKHLERINDFIRFLQSDKIKSLLVESGYSLP